MSKNRNEPEGLTATVGRESNSWAHLTTQLIYKSINFVTLQDLRRRIGSYQRNHQLSHSNPCPLSHTIPIQFILTVFCHL